MPTNSYFTLTTSDSSVSKKFNVLQTGYEPIKEKMQNVQTTLSGGLDISLGGIYETHNYMVRVRHTETRDGFGTMADLAYFYSLNNPNSTQTPVITLTDHYGSSHLVFMVGQYVPQALSVTIEGTEAYFNIRCSFKFIPG